MSVSVEAMVRDDWDAVRKIYAEGIATGNATFENNVPDYESWDGAHRPDCRLVARENGRVIGWAALAPVSTREVYSGVAEVTVYLTKTARGRGAGKLLLQALVVVSEATGIWTLQAGIFPENTASIALHHSCGFRTVGHRERLAQLQSRWRDVLLLERRKLV